MNNPFKKVFVRRSKIQHLIDEARADEKRTQEKYRNREIAHLKEMHEEEKELLEKSLNSKVSSLERHIDEMDKKIIRSETTYFNAIKRMKDNMQASADLGIITEEMILEFAKLYTRLRDVGKRIKTSAKEIKRETVGQLSAPEVRQVTEEIVKRIEAEESKNNEQEKLAEKV